MTTDKEKIERLKEELTSLQRVLHEKNVRLDAMHWVWCSGGCNGGAHRFTPNNLTEEVVSTAERNTKRLRTWFDNANFKYKWKLMTQQEKDDWMKDNIDA